MLLVTVDVALDRLLVRDVLRAIISTIFFHRLFASVKPSAQPQEVLDVTYPAVEDAELDALIAEKVAKLVASLDANHLQDGGSVAGSSAGGLGSGAAAMDAEHTSSFHSLAADNPSPLHPYSTTTTAATTTTSTFTISALPAHSTFTSPTSKKSQLLLSFYEKKTRNTWFSKSEEEVCWEQWTITVSAEPPPRNEHDRARLDCAAEAQLQHVLLKIVEFAGGYKAHIPSITTADGNPFPYAITVPSEAEESWGSVFKKILVE